MLARKIAKGLSWRAFAAVDTLIVTSVVLFWQHGTVAGVGSIVAGVISFELLTKTALFTLHEKLWEG